MTRWSAAVKRLPPLQICWASFSLSILEQHEILGCGCEGREGVPLCSLAVPAKNFASHVKAAAVAAACSHSALWLFFFYFAVYPPHCTEPTALIRNPESLPEGGSWLAAISGQVCPRSRAQIPSNSNRKSSSSSSCQVCVLFNLFFVFGHLACLACHLQIRHSLGLPLPLLLVFCPPTLLRVLLSS